MNRLLVVILLWFVMWKSNAYVQIDHIVLKNIVK